MPEHGADDVVRILGGAHAAIVHGQIAYDDGHVGEAVKTQTPPADAGRSTLANIAVGEQYNMIVRGRVAAPAAGPLAGAAHGDMVYIDQVTNALSLNNPGAGRTPVGKIAYLSGEMGTQSLAAPTGTGLSNPPVPSHRVDLDDKVAHS